MSEFEPVYVPRRCRLPEGPSKHFTSLTLHCHRRHTGTALQRGLQKKAPMENQELEKEMRSMWGSLNGWSWPISRSSLAETVASLEPELLQWASPIEISAESTHVPLVDLISAPSPIDQSVSPYVYPPGTPDLSTAFIWDNTAKSAAGSRLGSARTSLDDCSAGTNLSCAAQRSDGLPRSTEELEAFQSPFTPETGQPPANSLQGSFWDEPWNAPAMELSASTPSSGLCTLAVLSPACSRDFESCEAATSRGTIAAADLRILDERAGSTDSYKSDAFAAAWPAGAPLPDHSPDPPRTPQPESSLAAVKLMSAAVAPVVAFPNAPGTPRPAAAPVRDQAPAHRHNAPLPSMRPLAGPPTPPARPAAAKVPDQACAQGGIASAWAQQPPARPPPPPAPAPITGPSATGCQHTQEQPSARTMAMLQKNRRQQKEYNQRKRVRLCLGLFDSANLSYPLSETYIDCSQAGCAGPASCHERCTRPLLPSAGAIPIKTLIARLEAYQFEI